ncbi:hypothetical protein AXK12_06015 [Cephaloticoccus capnophilus]|uniref:DUF4340 domain-containing protein n=1 Tax=Cephaloticoccus capnophilus TaxID=1548208 RepID=A0A139SL21_9BACT|nr:DUF4340 domain-containing protein [Cephaloticoccus capnophilus]KXU35253.1 hypothetical protein AXK12_06015 [Cephaloticoccus capnophilus]
MRTKVTLVLIFLNAALFVFIFKFERGWRTDQAQREARRRVLGPETASIQQLRISGPSLTTIELVRSGAQWSLTSPIDWPANPHAVNRILNELQFLEHETSFSVAELEKNKQSLADYGLEPPRLTIEFTPASTPISSIPATHTEPQRITLQVGDETKVGNRLYLLSPQRDRVHVVGLSLARSLNLPLEELRTDDVFSIPLFEARSLTLQNASASRVRIRQDGKHWSFEAPIIARANKPQVELTIAALNALRVHHFLPTGTASPSTPTTNAELRISLVGNNRQETLILLNEIEAAAPTAASEAEARTVSFVAALEGKTTRFVVEVPQPLLNTLRNAQDTLREPRILDFAPEALTAVTLSAPNQAPLTLQQLRSSADGQHTWQIIRSNTAQGPQLQPVDPQRMRELIQTLRRLSAQRFVSDAPSDADLENWGFNRPERKITLTLNPPANSLNTERESALGPVAEPQTLHLQIGRPTEPSPQVYARLSNARFVYAIPAELLEQTAPDPLNYRQHLLRELPETARFHSLTLTDLNSGAIVFETSVDDEAAAAETPAKGDGETPPASQRTRLFATLRRLEAASFIQDHFSETVFAAGAERPWRWRLDTTVRLPSGHGDEQSETSSLFLTERLGGDLQLAGSPQLGLVFAINQALLDALWPLTYRERSTEETTPAEPPSTGEAHPVSEAAPSSSTEEAPANASPNQED